MAPPDQPQGNNPEPEEGTGTTTGPFAQPPVGIDSTPAHENTFVDNLTEEVCLHFALTLNL
jgi:hypothetical protein